MSGTAADPGAHEVDADSATCGNEGVVWPNCAVSGDCAVSGNCAVSGDCAMFGDWAVLGDCAVSGVGGRRNGLFLCHASCFSTVVGCAMAEATRALGPSARAPASSRTKVSSVLVSCMLSSRRDDERRRCTSSAGGVEFGVVDMTLGEAVGECRRRSGPRWGAAIMTCT